MHSFDAASGLLSLAASPDSHYIVAGDKNDEIILYDNRRVEVVDSVSYHDKYGLLVNDISWNKQGSHVFLASGHLTANKGGLEALDVSKGKLDPLASLSAHTANCYSICFEASGKALCGRQRRCSRFDLGRA